MTAMTLDEAIAHVTTTNPTFEVGTETLHGVETRIFRNVPPNLRALLQASREAQGGGDAEYLVFGEERWTYDEFCRDIKRLSYVLQHDLAIGKGDPVAIASRNSPEFTIIMMAVASVGAVAVLLNAWWTTEELDYALKDSRARCVFADGARVERIAPLVDRYGLTLIGLRDGDAMTAPGYAALCEHAPDADWPDVAVDPEDDFAIMYSSGTTGDPKGVVLTHRGAINAVFSWLMQAVLAPLIDPPPEDAPPAPRPCVLIVTPLFHVTASHPMFLLSLPAGAKVVLMSKWDADEAARIIEAEAVTRFLGVPTQCADLIDAADRMNTSLETLEFLGSGGAKRPAAQVSELARRFPRAQVATGWGMTETNALGIGLGGAEYEAHPDAAGRPYPPLQDLKIVDDDGAELPVGSVGEIAIKGPNIMRCYLNKPEATAEVLRDGWLHSGDLGYVDADGVVTIVDRKKNIIIRGGENISCLDVEGALHHHPAVAEACVFPVPHARLGEVVGAAIQLRPGADATESDISGWLDQRIARFKIPDHYWIGHDPLPRGATDKTDRRVLARDCLQKLAAERQA
ncbi:class I adenylate-forming enzyme family protein [Pukyongiella litopenaei]|uniref:Acyl--CoA ligase n=1 Tax=Pukyongiella litopenaei TaxID=2605946 RepID=A0A2S0MUC3_9RHOB|nr:class I adenylate-forming enzyme family protein [Pukyongiella litopenaei]AVO39462.1 acyl--CoA ligase [Pukyongiella litopenaei]